MAVHYRLYQNKNKKSGGYQMWYGRAVTMGVTTTDQIADQIQSRCTATKADIKAVLSALVVVMRNEMQNGNVVKLDELGAFKITISTKGSPTVKEFSVSQNVRGVRVIFQPELHINRETGMRSRSLLDGCKVVELPKNGIEAEKTDANTNEKQEGE
ncbi:MAG: HU family DNA-binding protein [Prevotella sp.]|nr:HU family DNA-binding protein [Prevotella sp.]